MFKFVQTSVINSSANVALYDFLRTKGVLASNEKLEVSKNPIKEKTLGSFPIYLDGLLIIPDFCPSQEEIDRNQILEKDLGAPLYTALSCSANLLVYVTKQN
jgi:hypothetical protein